MDFNFKGAPWREKDDELIAQVAEIRRANGSVPALKEALDWADRIQKDIEKVEDHQSLLLFLLKHFELKKLKPKSKPKKTRKKNRQPKQ
ncbi:MAG: hypothetical protein WC095_02640 [Candidatus Paceibacterota bacterium]